MPLTRREQNSKNWKELKEISNGEHKSRWNMKRRHILIAVELAKYRTFRELQQLSNNYNNSTIDTPLPEMKNELKLFNLVNEHRPDSKEREIKFYMDVKEAKNIILENVNKKITDRKVAIRVIIAAAVLTQTYKLSFKFGNRDFMNISKTNRTLLYIRMIMDNFSEDYSEYRNEASDSSYFNDFSSKGAPTLKAFTLRGDEVKGPDKDGGYFPFSNTTDINLRKLQIYDADCKGNQEHCIIFALRKDKTCTEEQINSVKLALPQTNLKKFDLIRIAGILKRQIIISYFRGDQKKVRNDKYGQLNNQEPIRLGLYKSHYFINCMFPITKCFANNYHLLKDEKKREQIYHICKQRSGNNAFKYKKCKITAIQLLHSLFKQNLFTIRSSCIEANKITQEHKDYLGNIEDEQKELKETTPYNYLRSFKPTEKRPGVLQPVIFFGDTETDVNGEDHKLLISGIIDMESKQSHISDNFYDTLNFIANQTCSIQNEIDKKDEYIRNAIVYYHNLKYDKAIFDRYIYISSSVEKANSVYSFKCVYKGVSIQFIDSSKLLACSLSEFHKMFKLDIEKEGAIAYSFYKSGVACDCVSVHEYIKHLKQNEIKSFIHKITSNADFKYDPKTDTFDAMAYYKHYLNLDCLVLREGLKAFNECVKNITKNRLSIFNHRINTAASLGHALALINGCYDGVYEMCGNLREYVSSAVYGGRVNPNKKYVKKVLEVKGGIADFDCKSLYPSAMVRMCQEDGVPI